MCIDSHANWEKQTPPPEASNATSIKHLLRNEVKLLDLNVRAAELKPDVSATVPLLEMQEDMHKYTAKIRKGSTKIHLTFFQMSHGKPLLKK